MSEVLLEGNCLEVLKDLPDNSIDSVVTDPPYGLSFMGKKWDYDVPSVEIWKEVLRVLKPGGYLLSFGGTRTYHRMVVAIEDAGFEIRDQIQWLYGSGFPKSHNVEKATSDARFAGVGTALKPANEPIVLARKPLDHGLTIAENVLKHGTGGLNIDASRIGYASEADKKSALPGDGKSASSIYSATADGSVPWVQPEQGRFPANIILDEEAARLLDEQSGVSGGGKFKAARQARSEQASQSWKNVSKGAGVAPDNYADTGGASRFFYVSKASKRERGVDNVHPTVKPTKLMEYLIRLITPPGGIVLDPFMGSGSTGVAAKALNFDFIGIEMSPEYMKIAEKRIENTVTEKESA